MKSFLLFLFSFVFSFALMGAEQKSEPVKAEVKVEASAPVVTVAPAPAVEENIPPLPDTAPNPEYLPPPWLEKAMDTLSSLPLIGPMAVKVAQWLGVLASITTIAVTAIIGILRALMTIVSLAGLVRLSGVLEKFANGRVMYWLRFFSLYNAQKKETKDGEASKPPA